MAIHFSAPGQDRAKSMNSLRKNFQLFFVSAGRLHFSPPDLVVCQICHTRGAQKQVFCILFSTNVETSAARVHFPAAFSVREHN